MNERQLTVCAIALFVDGDSFEAIGDALNVTRDEAARLAEAGGNEQAAGTMGYMHSTAMKCLGSEPR